MHKKSLEISGLFCFYQNVILLFGRCPLACAAPCEGAGSFAAICHCERQRSNHIRDWQSQWQDFRCNP
jgi:hypothetical protein